MSREIQQAKSSVMPLTVLYAIARRSVRACLILKWDKRNVNGRYLSATGAEAWSGGIERISTGVSRERSQ